jgi:HlyD family secretion protein
VTEVKNKNKKRRTGLWIFLAIVVIAAALAGLWYLRQQRNTRQVLANIETEPYQRMTLNANIYGTGTVQPYQSAVLTWSTGGIVGDVNVALGEAVEKDQVLMTLDPESISVDILQAQIDVINVQNNLDDLYDNWGSELDQIKLDLIKAEDNLEDLQDKRSLMNYRRCTDERIEELEENLEDAERLYDFDQSPRNLRAVNTAQANLDFCRANYTEREVAETDLQISLAKARVADLEAQVELLADGPDPDRITILETQLAMAEKRLNSPIVEAPFDGVISALPTHTGDVVNVGTRALQLDNVSELYLDVQISEVDIPFVNIGQTADLIFDAYFETTFTGEVIEISPVGTSVQGVVEYNVRIRMLDADERIKPGMTAAVNIIVDEKEDVFVIPNDAIVSENGQELVYVRRNGSYEAVPVSLGSYSDFYSEVLEADIEAGELIAINPPAEITGEMPFGGPPEGAFGPFGN